MAKSQKKVKPSKHLRLFIKTPAEMMGFAKCLAKVLRPGTAIGLTGELGAGKTTFVKGFAAAYNIPRDAVTSPTFTLINEYKGTVPVFHADLYRIDSGDELTRTGIYDLATEKGFLLIEWPEKFKSLANYLDLFLVFSIKKEGRLIVVKGKKEILSEIENSKNFKRGN
jgi:tRNA threonylcarbamoyladenosine biosynthesis protein TsaE